MDHGDRCGSFAAAARKPIQGQERRPGLDAIPQHLATRQDLSKYVRANTEHKLEVAQRSAANGAKAAPAVTIVASIISRLWLSRLRLL